MSGKFYFSLLGISFSISRWMQFFYLKHGESVWSSVRKANPYMKTSLPTWLPAWFPLTTVGSSGKLSRKGMPVGRSGWRALEKHWSGRWGQPLNHQCCTIPQVCGGGEWSTGSIEKSAEWHHGRCSYCNIFLFRVLPHLYFYYWQPSDQDPSFLPPTCLLQGKSLFMPLRVLLTGKLHGPDMGGSIALLYKAGKSGVVGSEVGFLTLDERLKLLRELDWEAFRDPEPQLESATTAASHWWALGSSIEVRPCRVSSPLIIHFTPPGQFFYVYHRPVFFFLIAVVVIVLFWESRRNWLFMTLFRVCKFLKIIFYMILREL